MTDMSDRLSALEVKDAARSCLMRYMDLCDVPGSLEHPEQIGSLFTGDATWEGIGSEYTDKFGIAHGREDIVALVSRYLPPAEHFVRNTHLLGSERIRAERDTAHGRWIMQQLSLYTDGTAELLCARLEIDFEITRSADITARIHRFRTQRMFAAPLPIDAMSHLH
ncbi:nuclear transport factor 2 family protein [Rhodococcus sp. D-6]|nr:MULTISPECIES: nuclear transport factor 2 family protein [Rhodococcus]MCB8908535.1 nuclear transport factor 2 family protein [Rhodococcus rhodochrous]MDC3726665.1 nuclear transport factor 2 family protein [Rhodococcus sp. Rp3]TWH51523.1 SnoaL-like protein [Rhodococcus rhodochrous J38]WSE20552.1 nuclear transport factor 2 family protein [Rhodococcus sp. PD04]